VLKSDPTLLSQETITVTNCLAIQRENVNRGQFTSDITINFQNGARLHGRKPGDVDSVRQSSYQHDFPVCLFNPAFRGCQNLMNGLYSLLCARPDLSQTLLQLFFRMFHNSFKVVFFHRLFEILSSVS